MSAIAYSNNNVIFIAWQITEPIPQCLGFSLRRIDVATNERHTLPAWMGFPGQQTTNWQPKTTDTWPIQKFSWRDFSAVAGTTYQYEIVPMVGAPEALVADETATMMTNAVALGSDYGDITVCFNSGILSTQFVEHSLPAGPSGAPSLEALKQKIATPGDPLRNSLSSDLRLLLVRLLDRAHQQGGQCYCALYELDDQELVTFLNGNPAVHLILSNTGADDATNKATRQLLHAGTTDITDRMLSEGHIGHNKFVVYVDAQGTPQAVLAGSTNWTPNGLCAQANNALLIESPDVAAAYYDYWTRLKQDGAAQGPAFRQANGQAHTTSLDAGKTSLTLWFSPNTHGPSKPTHTQVDPDAADATRPGDMAEVFHLMGQAQEAILFLVFLPGTPSIVDAALHYSQRKPNLLVRGAVSSPKAIPSGDVNLIHRPGDEPVIVPATAINDTFGAWHRELLSAGNAIIHDKIVVIDPLSPNCVVVTGSHNLGYKASYANDENLVIIRGNQALAKAYAVHVLDVYDHYRFRYLVQQAQGSMAPSLVPSADWQTKYFEPTSAAHLEMRYWATEQ